VSLLVAWVLLLGGREILFIELFGVPGWEEHVRQHRERLTGADLRYHDEALRCPTRRHRPTITWPPTSMSSKNQGHHTTQSSDGSAGRVLPTCWNTVGCPHPRSRAGGTATS